MARWKIFPVLFLILGTWKAMAAEPADPNRWAPDLTLSVEKLFGVFTYWRQTDQAYEAGFIEFHNDHTWTQVIHLDFNRDRYPEDYQVQKGQYSVGWQADGTVGFWIEGEGVPRTFLSEVRIIGGLVSGFTVLDRSFNRREGDEPYFILDSDRPEIAKVLRVLSKPPGATVFVNGSRVPGLTPLEVKKPPAGEPLKIRVTLPGHQPVEKVMTLVAGGEGTLEVELKQGEAGLQITSLPSVKVYLDGRFLGPTPIDIKEVAAGQHVLELINEALGINQREVIDLNKGQRFSRNYEYTGQVQIDVGRACKIYRWGKLVGSTPFSGSVPVGRHVLTLVDGRGEKRQLIIDVPLNGTITIKQAFDALPEAK